MMLPRRYLPSIPALLALEAVARLGTASAAAAELHLTQGAVSRQLQVLEAQLGTPLIARENQRLTLTPAGQDYVAEVRRALQTLASASLALRANPKGGTLNLAILPAFGMHWLTPRLPRFTALHPEVTLALSTRLRPFDFTGSRFDAAVHYGAEGWPQTHALKLMDEPILAVAAPGLMAQPATRATDLAALPLLHLESRPGDWGRWFAAQGQPGLRPPGMLFDQFATLTQGAIHGLGCALLPTFLIGADLAAGRLIPAFGAAIPALGHYSLVWPRDRPARAPLTSFIRWLTAEAATPGPATP